MRALIEGSRMNYMNMYTDKICYEVEVEVGVKVEVEVEIKGSSEEST